MSDLSYEYIAKQIRINVDRLREPCDECQCDHPSGMKIKGGYRLLKLAEELEKAAEGAGNGHTA